MAIVVSSRKALIKPLLLISLILFILALFFSQYPRFTNVGKPKVLTTQQKLTDSKPITFVEGLFELGGIDETTQYFCCEIMEGKADSVKEYRDFFKELSLPEYQKQFLLLDERNDRALVSVEITKSGDGVNYYLYLEKQNSSWKLTSMRSLALTGMYEQLIKSYDSASLETQQKIKKEMGDQFDEMYSTGKLIIATDSQLAKNFTEHKNEYQELLHNVEKYLNPETMNLSVEDKSLLKKLALTTVYAPDDSSFDCDHCYFFMIGGMVDNAVGYAYIPNSSQIPFPDGKNYIMFRSLDENWYIYKTT
jgi:hypothetical protein